MQKKLLQIIFIFFFCLFLLPSHTSAAVDASAYADKFELKKTSAVGGMFLMKPKGTYTQSTEMFGNGGTYINSTGEDGYMALYKKGPKGDYSDDDLIGIYTPAEKQTSTKDGKTYTFTKANFYSLKNPESIHIPKGSPAEANALAYFTKDANAKTNLVNADGGAAAGTQAEIKNNQTEIETLTAKKNAGTITPAEQKQLDKLTARQESLKQTLAAQTKSAQAQQTRQSGGIQCIYYASEDWVVPTIDIKGCIAIVGNALLQLSAWILWAAAKVFDFSLTYGLNFKSILDNSKLVTIGWAIFRDIANIFFIFVMLFVSINIIIGSSSYGSKSLIAKVIVAAILINFSLFFTKAIVDVSNIMALQFYGKMRGDGGGTIGDGRGLGNGIAAAFMKGLKLETVYGKSGNGDGTGVAESLNATNMITVGFAGSALILTTAFVFFAGAILFIIRTGILIILMILSPLAFAAGAIPGASGYSSKWWSQLFNQALFAPIYLAIIYVVVAVVSGNYGDGSLGVSDAKNRTFAQIFSGEADSIAVLFQFFLIIFFMVAALIVASKLGAYGAKGALSTGKSIRDWGYKTAKGAAVGTVGLAARGAIGGTAYQLANSNLARNIVARVPGGGLLRSGLNSVAAAKFGTSKGYTQSVTDNQKTREANAEFVKGSAPFRGRLVGESESNYLTKMEDYQKAQKTAGTARENKYLGVSVDADGNPTGAASSFVRGTTRSDARAFKLAQQKHVEKLKKAGKQSVDKATQSKKYLEEVETLVGAAEVGSFTTGTRAGGDLKLDKLENLRAFKQQATAYGYSAPGGTLAALKADVALAETNLGTAGVGTTPGQLEVLKQKVSDAKKKLDTAETKLQQRLDVLETLHTPKEA